jgi:hypothetical protein
LFIELFAIKVVPVGVAAITIPPEENVPLCEILFIILPVTVALVTSALVVND